MKTNRNRCGFTLIDLMLVIACLVILGFFTLPRLARGTGCKAQPINCINNLKQVGLAFRIWAGDNNDKYPMSVSVTNGGAMELANEGSAHAIFMVMSNELNTPKILFCPNESNQKRAIATIFATTAPPGVTPFTATNNLSYFVGLDAEDTKPDTLITGDDNFAVGPDIPKKGLYLLSTNSPVEWTKERHIKQGNIGLADGSVQGFSTHAFRRALIQTGIATNRLAMP